MKAYFFCLLFAFGISFACHAKDLVDDTIDQPLLASQITARCSSAKEFITTFNYLKSHKELGLSSQEIYSVSIDVAKGCTGAAARFVKVFEVLTKSDAGTREAMKLAVKLADRSQNYCDTFIKVFERSYLTDDLDLDYETSLKLANALATDYKGDPRIAAEDFTKLVDFCVSDKGIGLAKPECGLIAGRVVKRAENFHVLIADEFIKLYRFLVADSGPSAPVITALQISENVTAQGPEAADNFITAYNFGIDRSGLDFTAQQSVAFAEGIAKNTFFNLKPDQFKKSIEDRLPASTSEENTANP